MIILLKLSCRFVRRFLRAVVGRWSPRVFFAYLDRPIDLPTDGRTDRAHGFLVILRVPFLSFSDASFRGYFVCSYFFLVSVETSPRAVGSKNVQQRVNQSQSVNINITMLCLVLIRVYTNRLYFVYLYMILGTKTVLV